MKGKLSKLLRAKPGEKHKVADFSTDFTGGLTKDKSEELLSENVNELIGLQNKFYAHNKNALLIVFQAMDAAGKDGTIKHVMSGVNPQGCQVFSFKAPSAEELDHDYMWRIMKCIPERGRIGIFNRSHYEEVLVTKVHPEILMNQQLPGVKNLKQIDKEFWNARYRQIKDIERYLCENGVVILKFFLHVSKEEQKERFLQRLDDETKNWKFSYSDLKERAYWDDYMKAYSDLFTHTSTKYAPWYIIPADHKWFMRYAVGKIIIEKMQEMKPNYPELKDEDKQRLVEAKNLLLNEGKDTVQNFV